MELGDRIALRRKQLNMTQDELAKKVGYSHKSSINKIELNINDISTSMVVKMAQALDTTIDYIMGWEEEPKKEEVPTVQLSDEDKKFIELLHLLDPQKKEKLLALLEVLANS